MQRGEREQNCLNKMINSIKEEKCLYFGLTRENRDELMEILKNVKNNEKASEFPDFVFSNGFIEHFQITSAKESKRKGSEYCKELEQFKNKIIHNKFQSGYEEVFDYPKHFSCCNELYDNLISSFKRNWENHIEKIHKYDGKKEVGIFMVEYREYALSMIENKFDEIASMSVGDIKQEKWMDYRISRDKKILNYICKFKEQLKYIIFLNTENVEIIQLANIPELLKLIPYEYEIVDKLNKMLISKNIIKIPMCHD